ncbi:U-box domain-containing protein [Candidatus Neptunochlamydia vexilliferae]|nr:U-box domain-containing protein [Candidatus Neptunochlamydia vexilliferae]
MSQSILSNSNPVPFATYFTPKYQLSFRSGKEIEVEVSSPNLQKTFNLVVSTSSSSSNQTPKKQIKALLRKGEIPHVVEKEGQPHEVLFPTQSSAASSSSNSSQSLLPLIRQGISHLKALLLSQKEADYPDDLLCPLTLDLFKDPVITNDGHTFEREAIEMHLKNSSTCPLTRKSLKKEDLRPNRALKNRAETLAQKFPIPLPASLTGKTIKQNTQIANAFIQIAQNFASQNELKQALKQYKQALLYTERSEDYAFLIDIYQKSDQPKKAAFVTLVHAYLKSKENPNQNLKPQIEKALAPFTQNPQIEQLLIRYYQATHQKQKAFKYLISLAEKQTNDQKAISYYEKALTFNPTATLIYDRLLPLYNDTKKLHLHLAHFSSAYSQKKIKEANSSYTQAQKLAPQDPRLPLTYLTLIDKHKKTNQTKRLYKQLLTLSEQKPLLYTYALKKILKDPKEIPNHIAHLTLEVLTLKKEIATLKQTPPIASSSSSSSTSSTPQLPSIAYGKAIWEKHFGSGCIKGKEAPLPSNIEQILSAPTPFKVEGYSGKVRDTHLLVWIPEAVKGVKLILDNLPKLFGKYAEYPDYVKNAVGTKGTTPHWTLMSKNILDGTRNTSYSDQKQIVGKYASKGYTLPHALDAAIAVLLHQKEKKEYLLPEKPEWTFTRCLEVDMDGDPVAIGGFAAGGLRVYHHVGNDDVRGVLCARKF